jgi:hypothetical protein
MNHPIPIRSAGLVASFVAAVCLVTMAARPPQSANNTSSLQPASYPAPTNVRVLPAELNGKQVHDIMEKWSAGLGLGCSVCHANDRGKSDQDGHPLLDFASDAKPEKATARMMYTMTEEINQKYIAKMDGSGVPVNCGTCHRGHMGPEPFPGSSVPVLQDPVAGPPPNLEPGP